MFLHICPACEFDCHHACWGIKSPPKGYMGGSKCTCEHDSHKQHKFVEVVTESEGQEKV